MLVSLVAPFSVGGVGGGRLFKCSQYTGLAGRVLVWDLGLKRIEGPFLGEGGVGYSNVLRYANWRGCGSF